MRVAVTILAAGLQAAATVASPLTSVVNAAKAEIQGLVQGGSSAVSAVSQEASSISASKYITTENWAGASRAGTNITFSTATVTVPNFETDPDGWTTGLAIFAGLDGYFGSPDKLTLAGIIISAVREERQYQFTALWRVFPDGGGSENEISFPIRAGHKIRLSLSRLSETRINGTVENLNTGQTVYRILDAPEPFPATDASWVVNRYTSMGDWMRWLDFTDPIKFTDIKAVNGDGTTLSLDGADLLDIVPSGQSAFTKCSIDGPSDLTCLHP
ncbi:unnamed protein product [Clonostachys rhizophaga]|uniref:Concanavalin A-like lectin/glucanase n=1 Tax=Clonostachys rhizophaga TaxID=160324 RepID=A0A9N9YTQ9_9HYPO|nr:unnamed protein product [Clonostachys rhizophaga]